jgi:glycerol transport system ATP-binding protein
MTLELDGAGRRIRGQMILHPVSLRLEPGSLNVLLGATLAGKTTLLRLMAGLDAPELGRVVSDGHDVTGRHARRRSVAMVYQQFVNYPAMTAFENIASPLRVAGRPGEEIRSAVAEAARLLRLTPYLDRRPAELSGGQQQRVAIARALVKGAQLVLMDEPLANLDYKLREELREELPRIFAASGAIFVYATTEPAEALMLGGNVATLHEGRMTAFGPAAEVFRRPPDLTTARVFSDPPLNAVPAVRADGTLRLATGHALEAAGPLRDVPEGPCVLGFRAHDLFLGDGAGTTIATRVKVTEITGSESFVHVAVGDESWVAQAGGVHRLEPDAALTVRLDPSRLFAFAPDGRLLAAPAS